MPIQVPNFQFMNYGEAVDQGNRSAGNYMRALMMADQVNNMPQQREFEQQQQQLQQQMLGFQYIRERAPLVTDERTYGAFRDSVIKNGLLSEEEIPQKYDRGYVNRIAGIASKEIEKFGQMQQIPGAPKGVYGQRGDKSGKFANVKDYREKSWAGKSGDFGGLKAADENAIYKQAASLFGGMYDPMSGRFSALSKDDAQRTQAIAERATRVFVDSGGSVTRSQAVTQAAREMGIDISNLGNQKDSDPLGIR